MIISRTAVNGPYDDVMFPRGGTELDWEAELGVVIGKGGSYIPLEDAHKHIAGYCVANDVSERQFQLERGSQWTKGKSADTLKPLGPWLVTRDEVVNANALDISMTVSGVLRQDSNTGDMMYTTAELVSRISEYLTWEAGDVMITGTPEGVAYGMTPPQYLQPGDILEAKIAGVESICAGIPDEHPDAAPCTSLHRARPEEMELAGVQAVDGTNTTCLKSA